MAKRTSTSKPSTRRRTTTSAKKRSRKGWSNTTKLYCGMGVLVLFLAWMSIFSNTAFKSPRFYVYIPRGLSIKELSDHLVKERVIRSGFSFRWLAAFYAVEQIRPGMYTIGQGWGNARLWYHFKHDRIRPTQWIELPEFRSRKKTIDQLCRLADVDDKAVWDLLKDPDYVDALGGFTTESVYVIFRAGRYRMYNRLTPEELLEYMYTHYVGFWEEERRAACKRLDITEDEAVIVASIVYSETKHRPEMTDIAGVYLNRLHKGMKLESDPTALFAANKMDAGRVRAGHITIDSDYNTYKRKGLPPGPIAITPSYVIDEVLRYTEHPYFFFCANSDFSGTHLFAKDFTEHKKNATRYHNALDKRKK